MENQYRKISGYRDLSQEEVNLMNRIKAKGAELLELQYELSLHLTGQHLQKTDAAKDSEEAKDELRRFRMTEPMRWASIGKTDIQTGIMALVRAVAQPDGV